MSGNGQTIPVEMPQLAAGGESPSSGAALASWLVSVGDRVEAGSVIAELETDKATVELESPASGSVVVLRVEAGTEGIQPGEILAEIRVDEDGEKAARAGSAGPTPGAPTPPPSDDVSPSGPEVAVGSPNPEGRATPLARRAAATNAIDLSEVEGSGPGGRVLEADVLRLAEGSGSKAVEWDAAPSVSDPVPVSETEVVEEFRLERLTSMRRTIARRLTDAKQNVPHFYLRTRVELDALMAIRRELNEALTEEGRAERLSVNDFVVRATGLALRDVPEANVQFAEEGMRVFERVDVSVAVATEGGLVTPVVRGADRKGLVELSAEIRALADQARSGRLRPEQYQGGTVTVSNLGMYGIETVYPILNPPQACIVGVGAAEAQPVVKAGEIAIAHVAAFTLAADHRAVDGAVGARLLARLREHLEDPLGMML